MCILTLADLFSEVPFQILSGETDFRQIRSVVADSRLVKPGDLFVATVGKQVNAHHFIPQAVHLGAAAVVGLESGIELDVPYLQVEDTRVALAHLSAAFQGYPARKITMIGVTGTDGKTTTCNLIYKILKKAGISVGMISTVNAVIGDELQDTGFHVTTPDSPVVQDFLAKMLAEGLTHVILETTSHGWSQHRVDACEFDIGVITNITHEHLDEHGDYQNYLAAKARLFQSLPMTLTKASGNPRLAVINADEPSSEYLKTVSPPGYRTYSLVKGADICAQDVRVTKEGSNFIARGPDWKVPVQCLLPGMHNVSNCLAAITAATFGLRLDPSLVASGIANLRGIPGRMEIIDIGQKFTAIVDFAHTPNALKNTIETVRSYTKNRVITVFGSAGLRDRQKRRMMAQISIGKADLTILTAEDPRTESLDQILAEMADAAKAEGGLESETFWLVHDRSEAIRFGTSLCQAGDTLIVCGKGHEQSMCFGEIEYPWDDRIALHSAIAERLGIPGPDMPLLPTRD